MYLEPPRDVKIEGKIWILKKPICELNDTFRKFWLRVKNVFEESRSAEKDPSFYWIRVKSSLISKVERKGN